MKKKLAILSVLSTAVLAVTMVFAAKPKMDTFALMSRGQYNGEYTNEFVCRTRINGQHKPLTYTDKKLEEGTISEATCLITFTSNTTATLKFGNTFLGWSSKTDFTTSEYEWNVHDGALYTQDESRLIMYQAGTANTAKVYAVSNISDSNYYPVYFYTADELNLAESRCNWADNDRRVQLTNLAYELPVEYTISFDANGGTGTMNDIIVTKDTEFSLPPCEFTEPSGYIFDYWSLDDVKQTSAITITEDITLVANWKVSTAPANEISFTLSSASSVTKSGVTVSFAKASGSTAPTWYSAGLRLYANNTITISSSSAIASISFDWEKQGSKAFATASASVGDYTHPSNTGTGIWTGSATTIIFTLGGSGQLQLNTFLITLE